MGLQAQTPVTFYSTHEKSKILDVYKCAKEKSLGNYARRRNL